MLAQAVLFGIKHPKALPILFKIGKSVSFREDGYFVYTSSPMHNPADTVIIDNIKADHTIWNLKEERNEDGTFKSLSGWVG